MVALYLLYGFANGFSVHGIGMVNRAKAATSGSHNANAETKGVKKRENAHDVFLREMDHLANAFDVGEYVVMGQHDAFRGAGAAAGEYDCRQLFGLSHFCVRCGSTIRRKKRCYERRLQFVGRRETLSDFFEKDHPGHFIKVRLGQK